MFTIRKNLSEFDGVPQNQRWNQDEEVFQSTFDGGATWVDTPNADPRHNPAFITTATGDQCDVAQGFSNFVRQFVDSTYDAFNVVGISSAAITVGLLFVPPLALFWRIAQLVADGIVAIGSVTLAATFTEEVYDEIRDIAFCHIDANGHFDQADFDAIGEQLQEDIGGSAFNITMALMYNLYGLVGFSNASIELAEAADCSGATCEWCIRNTPAIPGDTVLTWGDVIGANWHPNGAAGFPYLSLRQNITIPAGSHITGFFADWSANFRVAPMTVTITIWNGTVGGGSIRQTVNASQGGSDPIGLGDDLTNGVFGFQLDITTNGGADQYAPFCNQIWWTGTGGFAPEGEAC